MYWSKNRKSMLNLHRPLNFTIGRSPLSSTFFGQRWTFQGKKNHCLYLYILIAYHQDGKGGSMTISTRSIKCPIAKREVTAKIEIAYPRPGLPPVENFKDCDGLATCGVRQSHSDGYSFNWDICPLYRNLNGR